MFINDKSSENFMIISMTLSNSHTGHGKKVKLWYIVVYTMVNSKKLWYKFPGGTQL